MANGRFADLIEEMRLMRFDWEMPSDFEDKLMDLSYELADAHAKDCNEAEARGYADGQDDSRGEWF